MIYMFLIKAWPISLSFPRLLVSSIFAFWSSIFPYLLFPSSFPSPNRTVPLLILCLLALVFRPLELHSFLLPYSPALLSPDVLPLCLFFWSHSCILLAPFHSCDRSILFFCNLSSSLPLSSVRFYGSSPETLSRSCYATMLKDNFLQQLRPHSLASFLFPAPSVAAPSASSSSSIPGQLSVHRRGKGTLLDHNPR